MFFVRALSLALILISLLTADVLAQESAVISRPIESDAEKAASPSSDAFTAETPAESSSTRTSLLQDLDPFFRDAGFIIAPRSFYFARQDGADEPGNDREKISWALGGAAKLKTGRFRDFLSINAELFTSQNLYGPKDKDGALLLEPGQEGYTELGVASPRFDYGSHSFVVYRQRHELPYINSQENRMTPNTFESYTYGYLGEGESPPLQLGMGYLDKIKKRNSDEFISMSEAAGVSQGERGMPWIGARFRPLSDIKIVAVDYAGLDFLNIFYSDAEYTYKLSEKISSKSSVQFSEQRSLGDDLLTGEAVSAAMWGFQQSFSYKKFLLRAALTANDKGAAVRSPFGSYPGYNSAIVEDFNRAGETAWKFGLSYDFAELGLDGLTAYVDYIDGNGAVDDNHLELNDKQETDINIDYKFKEGILKNLWLRLRGGFVHEDNTGVTEDYRVIINYEIALL